jgi:RNA polymerase sigma-70 factor (ECF subfamily)
MGSNERFATLEFQSIHDCFRPRILRYLKRLVGENEADDIAQSVMLKVSEGLPGFRGDSSLATWIYRIATNAALDSLRRKTSRPPEQPEFESEEDVPPDEQVPSIEATAIRREMNACIRGFIERLPENYRAVMVLSELEGFENGEIAAILGISLDTVKIRLHRAREKLRKSLDTGCSFYRDERDELACERNSVSISPLRPR